MITTTLAQKLSTRSPVDALRCKQDDIFGIGAALKYVKNEHWQLQCNGQRELTRRKDHNGERKPEDSAELILARPIKVWIYPMFKNPYDKTNNEKGQKAD
jgi:hypothetical protein